MPDNFARKLLAVHRGTPEETVEFWDDLDYYDPNRPAETPTRQPVDRCEGGRNGYRASRLPQDQDDLEEGRWQ